MNDNEQPTPPAGCLRTVLEHIAETACESGDAIWASEAREIADALLTDPRIKVRLRGPVTDAGVNEATPALLNDFYISGLRRAIEIIQNEDYPLSFGLARVDAMVSDIQDEIELAKEAQQ